MDRIESFAQGGDGVEVDPRLAHILEAAKDEFLANGFADATIDGIAKTARISKQTLYRHFQDKADLFEAVIVEDMRRFRNLPDLTRDTREAEEVLFEAARWIYDNHVSGPGMSMSKILIGAATHFGALIKRHHEFRFQTSVSWITTYIKSLSDKGVLDIADPHRAAVRFALLASEGSRPVMGYPPASPKDRERFARMTVALFMRGLGGGKRAKPLPA
ncbi:MAG: transcriptional regulator [Rhodospirillales bacterium]|nr:transcriptional regulator [Rhodospirillales bacterium]